MSVVGTDRKGHSFEKRVAYFFALHGYQVNHDVEIAGRQIDLLIESRTSLFTERYLVECKDLARPVNAQEYDKFKTVLDSARRALDPKLRGVIVASVGFTRSIKAQSAHDEIQLITISELEQSFIDFRSYVRNLIVRLQADPDLEWYVEPRVRREHATLAEPASGVFEQWLTDAELNQLTLLGDYGTGKTTFLKQVALQMGERYETEVVEGGARGRVPILVDLREHAHDLSLRELVVALLKSHRVQVESYEVFDYMLRDGQILLLLDGFDEMASRGSYETTLRNFRRLNQSVLGKAKIVLSSRTHYFTTEKALHRVLGNEGSFADLAGGFTQLYRDIAQRPNFKIVYMEEFGRDQVDDYLHKRYGRDDGRLRGFIEGTYNLEELSKRPVFLDMIVDSRERLQASSDAVTAGVLYQLYSNDWLSRNDWCTQLDVATKSELLQWFADRVDQEPDYLLPYRRISDLIKSWQPGIETTDEQGIDRELRSASFLVRDEKGNYKFSHGSFQEFFLARHLLSMAAKNQDSSWGKRFFKGEVYRFLRDLVPADKNVIDSLLDWIGDGDRPWIARANATKVVSAATEYCESVPRLLEALNSEDQARVRPYILTALGYFRGNDVASALRTVILEDPHNVARGNALAALARCGGDGDFVLSVLNGEVPAVEVDAQTLWPLFKQAPDLQDDRIARAILSRRPLDRRSRMASMCLRICQRQSVPQTERYCRDVLEVTTNPRVAANAFELLPIAVRKRLYPRILQLFEGRKRMGSKIRLIECLKGLREPEVGEFLTELVERAALAAPPVTFKLLQTDYPEVLAEHADDWGRRGRPHLLRLAVAEHLAKVGGGDELDRLEQMLAPRERPRLKLEVLRMMFEANNERFAKAVKTRWAQEPAPYVARYAMELLRTVDAQAAMELMLTKGIENPRPGTRIAVCTILGDEKDQKATQALLDRVSQDESPWVRRQALRSLLSPGRGIDSAQVLEATSGERDEVVLSLRRELLG